MKDNLERLTDILNIELKNIKVSEELKLKTLEKCKVNKKISAEKGFLPIVYTIAACLLMGVIVYPIYNNSNLVGNKKVTINSIEKEIDKSPMDPAMRKNEISSTEGDSNKIIKSEIVKKDQKEVNGNSEEQKQEKEELVLNESSIIPFKMKNSAETEERDKGILTDNKDITVATREDIVEKEKYTKNDTVNSSIVFSEEKQGDLETSEEVKMKILSLQEARRIFQDNMKTPSYVPRDFVIEKVLVPEIENTSHEVYEIIYSNNSEYFKITEYKNTNDISGVDSNRSTESAVSGENNMIININNIPVKYMLNENADNKMLPYVKLTWEYMNKKYSAEGNAPWVELINIISSIISSMK